MLYRLRKLRWGVVLTEIYQVILLGLRRRGLADASSGRNRAGDVRCLAWCDWIDVQNLFDLFLWVSRVAIGNVSSKFRVRDGLRRNSQSCVDYPFKVFLSFLGATRASSDSSEETRVPLNPILGSPGGFISLRVLDSGLLVRSEFVVPVLYGLRGLAPQSLRLLLILLLYGPDLGRRWLRAVRIEERILVASLLCRQFFLSHRVFLKGSLGLTFKFLMTISSLHNPENSYSASPVFSFLMVPPMALYVPPTQPFVLNSKSAMRPNSGHRTKL